MKPEAYFLALDPSVPVPIAALPHGERRCTASVSSGWGGRGGGRGCGGACLPRGGERKRGPWGTPPACESWGSRSGPWVWSAMRPHL